MKVENILAHSPLSIAQKIETGIMVGGLMKVGRQLELDMTVGVSSPIRNNTLTRYEPVVPNRSMVEIVGSMYYAIKQGLAVRVKGKGFSVESLSYPNSNPVILFDLTKDKQRSSVPQVPVGQDSGYLLE